MTDRNAAMLTGNTTGLGAGRWARLALALLAALATLAVAGQLATARADFGVAPGAFTTSLSGTQAGAPGEYDVSFTMNQVDPADPNSAPDGTIGETVTELPAGLLANPTGTKPCGISQLTDGSGAPCPNTSAVGTVAFKLYIPSTGMVLPFFYNAPLFRLQAQGNEAAAFGFAVFGGYPIKIGATVDPSNGYRVKTTISNQQEGLPLAAATVTLWGVPEDHTAPGSIFPLLGEPYGDPQPGLVARHRFLSVPGRCDGGPFETRMTLTSWQTRLPIAPLTDALAAPSGCDRLVFNPAISVTPSVTQAAQPSGYRVDLSVPQSDDAYRLSTPNLKDAEVTLPAGVAVSPASADGLAGCTDDQLAIDAKADETCPAASKIGDLTIDTPLLDDQVQGSIYLGNQLSQDPQSGNMYRIFLTAKAPGVKIKLRGAVKADPSTGQLTATFLDNPQLPFSKMSLTFKEGARAPLTNPAACGTYATATAFTSWAGQRATPSASTGIDRDCGRESGFAPSFTAGVENPVGAAHTAFHLRIARDGGSALSTVDTVMPTGLLAYIADVPRCAEAQAAAGTCGSASRIGSTTVAAGTGSSPLVVPQPGKAPTAVYLAGPYKGAPFSLSIVVPAQAGPYDLGTVVVRAALHVDPVTAQVTVKSDPLPTILGGIPLNIRDIRVDIDRPGFMVNPTSCDAKAIGGTLGSAAGQSAAVSARFQVGDCASLDLSPKLDMVLSGKGQTTDNKHPALKATLTQPAGQANLKNVKVSLPLSLALDPDNSQSDALCEFAAGQKTIPECPEASIVGTATAKSPILDEPLTGPVYFVKNVRIDPKSGRPIKTLPTLAIPLRGAGVTLVVRASSGVVNDRLVTTFADIPDAAVSSFELNINGGPKGILVVSGADVCKSTQVADQVITGQSGKVDKGKVTIGTPCDLRVVGSSHTAKALKVTVGGIGAGKVSVSGPGLRSTSRKIASATTATVVVPLSKASQSKLAQHRDVKVTVKVRYTPTGKKGVTTTKRLTIHGAKAKAKPKR
jgi:hypothetical protein